MTDDNRNAPIMTDQPEDEEELRARERAAQAADASGAPRGTAVAGALAGIAGPAGGIMAGMAPALGEEQVKENEAAGEPDEKAKEPTDRTGAPPA
jgi:hypothetical protein